MDFVKNNNFKGLYLVKKLAKSTSENIIPKGIDLDNTISYQPNIDVVSKLASALFADEYNREYPIDTPQNTWLSAVYYYTDGQNEKTASINGKNIETHLQLAAEMHGIGDIVDNLCNALGAYYNTAKVASVEAPSKIAKFAYADEGINYLPISTQDELIDSAKQLDKNRKSIPLTIFKKASENIMENVDAKNRTRIPVSVKIAGTHFLADPDKICDYAEKKYAATKYEPYKDIVDYVKFANAGDEELSEAINLLYEADMANGIDYSKDLDPFAACASVYTKDDAIKMASEFIEINNALVPMEVMNSDSVKEGIKLAFAQDKSDKILDILSKDNAAIKLASAKFLNDEDLDLLLSIALKRG